LPAPIEFGRINIVEKQTMKYDIRSKGCLKDVMMLEDHEYLFKTGVFCNCANVAEARSKCYL